jgi:hypothetical protein
MMALLLALMEFNVSRENVSLDVTVYRRALSDPFALFIYFDARRGRSKLTVSSAHAGGRMDDRPPSSTNGNASEEPHHHPFPHRLMQST